MAPRLSDEDYAVLLLLSSADPREMLAARHPLVRRCFGGKIQAGERKLRQLKRRGLVDGERSIDRERTWVYAITDAGREALAE